MFYAGMALLAISLVRTAWLSDDAYITFRTVDNIIHGFGPVWNVSERVQTYTHPLWLAICTSAMAITGDAFFTGMALGAAFTIALVLLLARRVVSTSSHLAVCLAALLSSKAFIDFSTSGLENPLSHLFVLLFLLVWWNERDGIDRVRRLSFVTSLALLTRMDLAPLLAPALAYEAWRQGLRRSAPHIAVGLAPFLAWEAFATFYYGSPFPNTAYAKLNTAMSAAARLRHGVNYLVRTATGDPVTLPVIAAGGLTAAFGRRRTADWPLAAGLVLFSVYVVRIGGDWMMGRFLSPPFVLSVGLLGRAAWLSSPRRGGLVTAGVLILGLFATWEPAIVSGYGYSYADNLLHGRRTQAPRDNETKTFLLGVMDERRYYSEATGLIKSFGRGLPRPNYQWSLDGLRLRSSGPRVVVASNIGMLGYFAGPGVHIVDSLALGDPLLARLPGGGPDSEMGHFGRPIPDGYLDTIATGTNRLADADLADYYGHLHAIIAGPLWSSARLATLVRFLAGSYDPALHRYVARTMGLR